jgi:hypothetical protein
VDAIHDLQCFLSSEDYLKQQKVVEDKVLDYFEKKSDLLEKKVIELAQIFIDPVLFLHFFFEKGDMKEQEETEDSMDIDSRELDGFLDLFMKRSQRDREKARVALMHALSTSDLTFRLILESEASNHSPPKDRSNVSSFLLYYCKLLLLVTYSFIF